MKIFTMPSVLVQLTPKFRVIVDGADRTGEYRARAAVSLTRIGVFFGWAQRQLAFGHRNGLTGTPIPDEAPVESEE